MIHLSNSDNELGFVYLDGAFVPYSAPGLQRRLKWTINMQRMLRRLFPAQLLETKMT